MIQNITCSKWSTYSFPLDFDRNDVISSGLIWCFLSKCLNQLIDLKILHDVCLLLAMANGFTTTIQGEGASYQMFILKTKEDVGQLLPYLAFSSKTKFEGFFYESQRSRALLRFSNEDFEGLFHASKKVKPTNVELSWGLSDQKFKNLVFHFPAGWPITA